MRRRWAASCAELGLGPVALVTHDWGVAIALMWACDNPGAVSALVVSDGGFFADREWHDMAKTMRTPEVGEQFIESFTREGLGTVLKSLSTGMTDDALDQYWRAYADPIRRRGILELYRSGDFEKLIPLRRSTRGARRSGVDHVGRAGFLRRH